MMAPQPPKHIPEVASLPPFDATATCPKCGNPEIEAKYRTYTSTYLGNKQRTYEWIRRTCIRCGFLWDERCLSTASEDRSWSDDEDWSDDDEA